MQMPVRGVLAAAALVGLTLVPDAHAGRRGMVYYVPAGPQALLSDAPTLTASEAGRRYEVLVEGVYSYNGSTGLADCGYFSTEGDVLAPWTGASAQFRIDGRPPACGRFNDEHVYQFEIVGTGQKLVFDIFDVGGREDNLGGLRVTISPAI